MAKKTDRLHFELRYSDEYLWHVVEKITGCIVYDEKLLAYFAVKESPTGSKHPGAIEAAREFCKTQAPCTLTLFNQDGKKSQQHGGRMVFE